jgi:4-amino-4-deoxy-L-arabinose transferase-like glycosyltransferase
MQSRPNSDQRGTHIIFICFCVIVIFLIIAIISVYLFHNKNKILPCLAQINEPKGAKEALGLMKDTTTWMAGIQTATIAALGFIAKEGITSLKPTPGQIRLSIIVVLLNSFALFFSAWVLTALPAVMLRVYSDPSQNYDFFNLPLYNMLSGSKLGDVLTVNFAVTCNHWLWGLGVLFFGVLCIWIANSRSQSNLATREVSM